MKNINWYYKYLIFNLKKKINIDNHFCNSLSLDEIFNFYGSDKGTKVVNPYSKNSDRIIGHGFGRIYDHNFKNLRKKKFNLLEIGTWQGASLASFAKYFEFANIYGLDRNFKLKYKSKRIFFEYCDTSNSENLKDFKKKFKHKKFKIIIDDGSHLLTDIIQNFKFFINFLDKSGVYVIEDFNHPKYYEYLNNARGNELYFSDIIKNLKDKKFFKSNILNENDQRFLHKTIKFIYAKKGIMIESGKNVSDIVFFKF